MTIDGGLRPLLRSHLPQFHWTFVETGLVAGGVPDCNYCVGGIEGWVECKRTSGWAVKFRPEQVAWIDRRRRAGGRVHVAVRRATEAGPRRGEAVDELWLFAAAAAPRLALEGLRGAPVLDRWAGGPAGWDWAEVGRLLAR